MMSFKCLCLDLNNIWKTIDALSNAQLLYIKPSFKEFMWARMNS